MLRPLDPFKIEKIDDLGFGAKVFLGGRIRLFLLYWRDWRIRFRMEPQTFHSADHVAGRIVDPPNHPAEVPTAVLHDEQRMACFRKCRFHCHTPFTLPFSQAQNLEIPATGTYGLDLKSRLQLPQPAKASPLKAARDALLRLTTSHARREAWTDGKGPFGLNGLRLSANDGGCCGRICY